MSAAQEFAAAVSTMGAAQKREFLRELNEIVAADAAKAEAKEEKQRRLASVKAAREKARADLTAKNSIAWIDGLLRRAGAPSLEEIAEAGPSKLDSMLASAQRLSVEDRLDPEDRVAQARAGLTKFSLPLRSFRTAASSRGVPSRITLGGRS